MSLTSSSRFRRKVSWNVNHLIEHFLFGVLHWAFPWFCLWIYAVLDWRTGFYPGLRTYGGGVETTGAQAALCPGRVVKMSSSHVRATVSSVLLCYQSSVSQPPSSYSRPPLLADVFSTGLNLHTWTNKWKPSTYQRPCLFMLRFRTANDQPSLRDGGLSWNVWPILNDVSLENLLCCFLVSEPDDLCCSSGPTWR